MICANSNQDCVLPTPDRAEVSVYADGFEARDGVGFGFDDPKYFGFLMYFPGPPGFSLVSGYDGEGVHFMQAWQYHSSEADGCGVPLVATLENSNAANLPISPVQVRLTAHDQVDGFALANPPWPLTVNAWHRFVFFLDPNNGETEGLGQVTAWLDGHLYVDWHHDWGCNTRAAGSAHTDKWHLRVGMYRTSSGVVDQRLDMFFDNIRVAPSLGLAAAL